MILTIIWRRKTKKKESFQEIDTGVCLKKTEKNIVYSKQNIKEHLKGYMKECMKNTKKDKKTLMLKLLV